MFAGVVAHDLQRPLSVMRGFTELVHDDLTGRSGQEDNVDYLERVLKATSQMSVLINDLLTYATARDAQLTPITIDAARLVREIVDEHMSAVRAEPAAATPEIYIGSLPAVHTDYALTCQLFNNLIGNAIKYTPHGRSARVDITGEPSGEGWVRIMVADRGIGIPPGHHDKIFNSFHRAAIDYAGTGLGLAICQQIVQRHGGTITAGDNPGGGARFLFTLPAPPPGEEPTSFPGEECAD
ncbi:sensor histidine kinase [Spirillospora albida]|uniref:sensor histidine kinase n=1 Tax=Spirillospora albida TaxID=58123 RepID=UPI003CCC423B